MRLLTWTAFPTPLESMVSSLWYCDGHQGTGSETVLPSGQGQLVLGLHGTRPIAVIHGPMSRPSTIDATIQRRAAGLSFHAVGLAWLIGDSVAGICNQVIDLHEVWGRDATRLLERAAAAASPEQVRQLLEHAVLARVHRREAQQSLWLTRRAPILEAERRLSAGHSVAATAADVGLDRRVLTRRFTDEVGLPPKTYGGLRRFQRALLKVRRDDSPPLATIAATAGYADQAHLTREFRRFSGCTPGQLHRIGTTSPNHLPEPRATQISSYGTNGS